MQQVSDNLVLFVVSSIVTVTGWAIRTHFKLMALEGDHKSLDTRVVAQDVRISHMDGSLNSIFIELAKIGAKLDNLAVERQRKNNEQ